MNFIETVVDSMLEYQKQHNIVEQCVTNVQFLYDTMKSVTPIAVKAKAVLVYSYDAETDTTVVMGAHLVLQVDNEHVLEPSYDVDSLKNVVYFDNVKDFISILDFQQKQVCNMKKLIKDHVEFLAIAKQMNTGKFLIIDRQFYREQALYVATKNNCTVNKL